ncbi:ATP-binding protein [Streptomyces sp. 549]|uniref:ATP-binding protein n=1 Tax=Streptomyces sp. 549 TaxID=3049076 RepID=UPI0024C2B671|nr:ATP-binding protein [Streptomyces sp. 549]MDK1472919.1 ATP-binding protein [Streptomyces sp. 549]
MTTDSHAALLQTRLTAARDRAFVGREEELELFRTTLAGGPDSRPVLYLHGPGGIGKSTLLHRFAVEAQRAGRAVVTVDGRALEPTPEAFTAAAAAALTEPEAVLLVDTFERCQGLEGWLVHRFLPRIPLGTTVVVSGRDAPSPRWTADSAWTDLLHTVPLGDLAPHEAALLLRRRGVPERFHDALLCFTGGNPLALSLAAAVAVREGAASADWAPTQDVVSTLLCQLVGDLPGPEHRRALEVCAHAHVTSEALLRSVLGDRATDLFAWLRRQPFVESTHAGLCPHDAIREALGADLRWRDPDGFADMHRRLLQAQLDRIRTVSETQLLPAVAALLFLYRTDRQLSRLQVWDCEGQVRELLYEPAHREQVLRLARRAEGEDAAALVAFWLDRCPEAFRVYRSTRRDTVVAFSAWLRMQEPVGTDVDPVVAAAWTHVRAAGPLRAGDSVGIARFSVAPEEDAGATASPDLMQVRALGEILRADRLAWSFVVTPAEGHGDGRFLHFDMHSLPHRPQTGHRTHRLLAHDWRTHPVAPWLEERTRVMLSGAPDTGTTSDNGQLTVLSRAEFDSAVRDALRALRDPEQLRRNPLSRSRVVVDHEVSLDTALRNAVEALPKQRGGDKQHRALATTYLAGAPTQEAAARRLQLPFSTYRRHLSAAVRWVCDYLWQQEVNGADAPRPAECGRRLDSGSAAPAGW